MKKVTVMECYFKAPLISHCICFQFSKYR